MLLQYRSSACMSHGLDDYQTDLLKLAHTAALNNETPQARLQQLRQAVAAEIYADYWDLQSMSTPG